MDANNFILEGSNIAAQEKFLSFVKDTKLVVSIYLISGIKLGGTVIAFDEHCILLTVKDHSHDMNHPQMIYKNGIACITPSYVKEQKV